MSKQPCRGCEHEKLPKSTPLIWRLKAPVGMTKKQRYEHNPELNFINPCYDCEEAQAWSEHESCSLEFSPGVMA